MAEKPPTNPRPSNELPLEGELPPHLTELWKNKLHSDYEFREVIGRGKHGLACRISRKGTTLDFCLKTSKHDTASSGNLELLRDMLKKEVEILSPLSHRCLPAIYGSGFDESTPYYICTYHPGKTVEEFVRKSHKLACNESYFSISALLNVLEYLHGRGRPHCDLHGKNVMIDEDVSRHGILVIDFGSGHRDTDTTPLTTNRGPAYSKDTAGKGKLQRQVQRDQMSLSFRRADFKALGTLLGVMGDSLFNDASVIQKQTYHSFSRDLERGVITEWSVAHERLLTVMDPMRKSTALDRLFLDDRGQRQSIPLPVSYSIPVGEAPLAVINTSAFQNLRLLNQLSFCEWRYPGATHTRFEHSLGVFNLVRMALHSLCNDTEFRETFSVPALKGCLLAGLLHDIGHYPLAHVVEQYAAGGRLLDDINIRADVSHTAHTKYILENDKELRSAIVKYWGDNALQCCMEILQDGHGVLARLLDGAIDCDKMDYLRRDALHCGVQFGRGLDIPHLFRNIRQSNDGKSLAILEAGVPGVEGFMVLQHQMLSSVYWHPTVRGIICMCHAALAHITKSKGADKLRALVLQLKRTKTVREAIQSVVIPAIKQLGDESFKELSALVDLHVNPSYTSIFRAIRTYRLSDIRGERETTTIYSSINRFEETAATRSIQPVDWDNVSKLRKAYRSAFEEKRIDAGASEIIVDVPLGKTSHPTIPVMREDGTECDILDVSHLSPTIFTQPAIHVSPIRVYVSPRLHNKAEHSIQSIIKSAEERFHHPQQ